jgi:hypothetical protein
MGTILLINSSIVSLVLDRNAKEKKTNHAPWPHEAGSRLSPGSSSVLLFVTEETTSWLGEREREIVLFVSKAVVGSDEIDGCGIAVLALFCVFNRGRCFVFDLVNEFPVLGFILWEVL